jgi:hypothetical protein
MHARLARPGCGRPSTPAWRRPAPGQPWPLASRPSSSSWPPSRSRCWCPATARRAARARRPTRRRAIRQEQRERRSRCRRPRRDRARPRCLQHPRRPLTRPRRLRPLRLRLRSPPRLRRSPPRLRPVPRRAAHQDTQGITAAEPGNLVQRPTAPNTQICAPRETSAKSQAAAPNDGSRDGHGRRSSYCATTVPERQRTELPVRRLNPPGRSRELAWGRSLAVHDHRRPRPGREAGLAGQR